MNPDEIHELSSIMIKTTIFDQSSAHEAVRNKRYIIGSYHPANGISFSAEPAIHYLARDARAECKRLAKLYPGKTYIYVCLEGAEMTIPQPTIVSI